MAMTVSLHRPRVSRTLAVHATARDAARLGGESDEVLHHDPRDLGQHPGGGADDVTTVDQGRRGETDQRISVVGPGASHQSVTVFPPHG
jgi:hypothetical protein